MLYYTPKHIYTYILTHHIYYTYIIHYIHYTTQVVDEEGNVVFEHTVEAGDIWRLDSVE